MADAQDDSKSGSALVTFLMVMVSTFAIAIVGMLFATGAAQRSGIPRVRAALERLHPAKKEAAADSTHAAAPDSSGARAEGVAWSAGADSLGLIREEIDSAMKELDASRAASAARDSAAAPESVTAGAALTDSTAEQDLVRLVKVMEAMKPADAARLLNEVDDGFTIDLVRRLKERQAAKVLTLLTPAKAKAVALALGRAAEETP